mmetsp:Transcript_37019/g.78549  ORF Transcript_37019/g.78549 Transcript_37019/m.78549 type:complete len:365 (-) Transcript_37019:31-1125(-)
MADVISIGRSHGPSAGNHVDAYMEYRNLVGDLHGERMLPEAEYEKLRKRAADGSKRLYVNYRNSMGLDCRAVGPASKCFCGHRYREHDWLQYDTKRLSCKMRGCPCACFNLIPVRGSADMRCTKCKHSYTEHHAGNKKCGKSCKCPGFASSVSCSCTRSYDEHATVIETKEDRLKAGRSVDEGWMQQAAQQGLPVCHLGGIIGHVSLADGVDRAMAGVEPGFAPEAVANSLRDPTAASYGGLLFAERMAQHDIVNTATHVQGRQAGFQAQAQVQDYNRGLRDGRGLTGGMNAARAIADGNQTRVSRPAPPDNRRQRTSASSQRSATSSSSRTGHTTVVPLGRRLGGARASSQDAMRAARLAKFG